MKKNIWRALVEMAFVILLFYSNLLIGNTNALVLGRKEVCFGQS